MSAQTVPTKYASVKGIQLAYRRFGKASNFPLLYLTHFRGTMDLIDPLLLNSIAKNREVILLDSAGTGHSQGTIEPTFAETANTINDFLDAISVPKVDILGFSLGGMVAQVIAVAHPHILNKLVLAGTQSSYTQGLVFSSPEVFEVANGVSPSEDDMLKLFFYSSDSSRALGRAWWARLEERHVSGESRTLLVDQAGGGVQQAAIGQFVSDATFFDKLKEIKVPVLVTNGKDDIMTPTTNSFILQQQLQDVELHIFPDSGHGHLYQFPEKYAELLELFLD
ncbi:Alpha/Beta hydrolase protein [Paraphoma chrysanthemicola]|nr:Alpha/Beta hydrolase protein [Paraphoma chrysanthemicola]